MNPLRDYHPLDQVSIRLETMVSATPEGLAETHRMLAEYLGLPGIDFTRPEVVRALVPPGWEVILWKLREGWSCFLEAGQDRTRGCGETQEEALLQAAVWAIREEEKRGTPLLWLRERLGSEAVDRRPSKGMVSSRRGGHGADVRKSDVSATEDASMSSGESSPLSSPSVKAVIKFSRE